MENSQIPPGAVVVGVDGSEHGERALAWAAEQAAAEGRPLVTVHALGVLPMAGSVWLDRGGLDYGRLLADEREAGEALLSAAADRARAVHPGLVVHPVLRQLDAREALLGLDDRATMLVLGSRGRGPVARLLLGSVSLAVSRHASCPVVVVRPPQPEGERPGVVAGTDGTERSAPAVEFGFRVAAARGLPLTVLHCFWDAVKVAAGEHDVPDDEPGCEEERALLERAVADGRARHPDVDVRLRLARGFADQRLLEAAAGADLLVLGTHPRHVLEKIVYGSLTPSVLEHADCTVAVVPYQG